MTGSSIFALLSFAFQDALLGTQFNWVAPSAFSGVSALSQWAAYVLTYRPQFLFLGVTGLAYLSRAKLSATKAMSGERKRYIKGILIL